jgi:23S rRNA (pseudouridine1915-N3)-methyltransferase
MLMRLIAAGTRMPAWVDAGFADYAGRLRGDYRLELVEIPLGQRGRGDATKAVAAEGSRMLAAAGERCCLVALQVGGRSLTTAQLARWLDERSRDGQPLAFCVGGPDGLAPEVDARARLRWSLSALTLPHALARIVAAEALYRAVSVLKGLPYHRA